MLNGVVTSGLLALCALGLMTLFIMFGKFSNTFNYLIHEARGSNCG